MPSIFQGQEVVKQHVLQNLHQNTKPAGRGARWEMCWSVGHRKWPLSVGGFQPLGGMELFTWFPDPFPPSSSKYSMQIFLLSEVNTNDGSLRMFRPRLGSGVWGHFLPTPTLPILTSRKIKPSCFSLPPLNPLSGAILMVEASSHAIFGAIPRAFNVS